MKLLLTSNGLKNPELEQAFLELTGNRKGLKMAFITTAGDKIEWVPEAEGSKRYIAKLVELNDDERAKRDVKRQIYKAELTEKGFAEVIFVDLKEDPEEVKKKLEHVDIIEVGGGDVNYLLDWAKIAKLDTYLKDLLDNGVVYVGSSAGCGLVMPDIGLTWWEPDEKWAGTDHIGFGIVDFVVVPHQKESDERSNTENIIKRKKYMQSVTDFPWKVYLLQDGQAVKVDGEKIEHIGPGVKNCI